MATRDLGEGNTQSDIINCAICLERFRKPKYLPCLHTFCQSCLNTYILTSTRDNSAPPTSFSCPICRTEVKPPQQSSSVEEWAELMPLNHMLFTIMDNLGTEKQTNDNNCDHCEQDDEVVKAVFRCLECRENLCETCRKYHKRQKAYKNHRVIPVSEVTSDDVDVPDIEEPCTEHKGEMMKVYCVDHKMMCCVICLTVNHRKCENVKTFNEMAENMKKNGVAETLKNKISDMSSKAAALLVQKKDNIHTIEEQHKNILAETSTIVEQAKEKLDHFHEKFRKKFSLVQKEHSTKLVDTKDRLENFQKFLSHCERTMKTITEYGSPQQTFVTLEKIKRRLDIQGKELEEFLKDGRDISYKLVLDQHLTALNSSMNSLAEIEIQLAMQDKFVFTTGDPTDAVGDLQHQLKSADISEIEAVKVWDVNVGGSHICGLFLDNGNLMFTNHGMKNLSVYDMKGKLLIKHSLDFKPWGICQSSDGCIYVSEYTAAQIRVYTMANNKIKELKCLKTIVFPRAINTMAGKILVQSGSVFSAQSIHSMTLDGQNHKEICMCSYYSGIAVNTSSGEPRFYHSTDQAVVCRSLDGKEVFRHNLQDIDEPGGVALDAADNIYVCGRNSKNIYVISKDGSSSRVFMSNLQPVSRPFSIGFDKTGTKFFVTDLGSGTMLVYNITLRNNQGDP